MNDDLQQLVDDYRETEAPPFLETRIRAEVTKRPVRNHAWLPVATTAVMAAAVIGLLPMLWQGTEPAAPPPTVAKPSTPSLSSLASIKVEKPAGVSPSLSKVRSIKAPAMPARPKLPEPREQTNSLFEIFEEKDHAHS